jgi:hypothetical protein
METGLAFPETFELLLDMPTKGMDASLPLPGWPARQILAKGAP